MRHLAWCQFVGHAWKLAVACAIALAARLPAQGVAPRWDFELRGRATEENGDLRFGAGAARILLQFDDSTFQPLANLAIGGGRIAFALPRSGRVFEGAYSDTLMSGTARGPDGATFTWFALPMRADARRWPVPPRVTVRQLLMGTNAATERVPGAWVAMVPPAAAEDARYVALATVTGVAPVAPATRPSAARTFALGLDERGRSSVRTLLAHIATGSAADPRFQQLFANGAGWRIDMHDVVPAEARHYLNGFQLRTAAAGLRELGLLEADADSAAIRESAWRLWSRKAADSAAIMQRIDSLGRRDETTGLSVRALMLGYDDATRWWRDAVRWLLTHRWLDTPGGARSPAELMAAFWGVDSLPLPEIVDFRFGDAAALPVVSGTRIGTHLFVARNASASEWLAQGGIAEALAAWLPIRWGESPLVVVIDGRPETVISPWAQASARPAAFFGARDAIRIDPGLTPVAAVAVFLHEWHHLIAAERRFAGANPAGLIDDGVQLRVREADPWLAEGFAEWATEETLLPAGESSALLRFSQSEKRLGIALHDARDPHVLGYGLVRAAATRKPTAALRDLLVQHLDDPASVARAIGFPGSGRMPPLMLQRPANSAVIPEVNFTWDDGLAFDISRRLVVSQPKRPEH